MAYARSGRDSDVYVYKSAIPDGIARVYHCVPCESFRTLVDLKEHLLRHLAAGDKVPDDCFDRIDRELAEGAP